ncbi:MAG: DNA ligase-associated DEXH box helicase [Acidobacteriota bacterium]
MNSSPAPHLEIRAEGLYAPAFDAWIDPHAPAPRAIVSHAHADHAAAGHGEVWATRETLGIYRRRNPDWIGEARPLAFGEPARGNGAELTLFPSGHILGSAQVRIEGAEGSVLYTGDFRRGSSRTATPAQAPASDVLITETTFGLPVFRFPARPTLEARLVAACRSAHEEGIIPVLLAYALGKSQEAALVLAEAGIPTVLHGAAWKLVPEYEAAGFSFPLSRPYDSGLARPGEVLIVPPHCARTPVVRQVKKRRIAYLSGWALREASRAEHDAEILLPFSDHADFDELLAHAAQVAPRRVLTHHGYARDFARILSARGVETLPLAEGGERSAEDP